MLPLFINFHGGGFLKGRRDQDIVFCRNICSKAGVALADVDYIPAPAMRYPGQLYAGFDVLQYMAEHGEEWNINVDKIAVGGHSAGGSLTAGLVLKAIQEKKFVPALQIIDYAPVDMAEPTLSKRNCDSNPKIPVWKMEFYNKMYMEPEDMKDIFASPLLAPDELLSKEPPTVVMYCDSDVFSRRGRCFCRPFNEVGSSRLCKTFYEQRSRIFDSAKRRI